MLTRRQKILLKRAQAEAGLDDADYREAIATVSGWPDCRSSKDARLTDGQFDAVISYFEAIHWQRVDSGALQPACKPDAVFRQRGYWQSKNRRANTSRDRYVAREMEGRVRAAESRLMELGCGLAYLQAIQNRIGRPLSLVNYAAALERTLAAKERNRRVRSRGDGRT